MTEVRKINDEQKAVIASGPGIRICVAGPGTGKTFTIVELIREKVAAGMKRDEVLVVSFSRKAALELAGKIESATRPSGKEKILVATVHGLCWRLLHKHMPQFESLRVFKMYESFDEFLGTIPEVAALDKETRTDLIAYLLECYANGQDPEDGPTGEDFGLDFDFSLIRERMAELFGAEKISYENLIAEAVQHEHTKPGFFAVVGQRFKLIVVDEFQDLNRAQREVVFGLAQANSNLLLVGDPNQSIHGFRHVIFHDIELLLRQYQKLPLAESYRCIQPILDLAGAILPKSQRLTSVATWKGCPGVRFTSYDNEWDELSAIVAQIKSHLRANYCTPDQIAILFRTRYGDLQRLLQHRLFYEEIPFVPFGEVDDREKRYVALIKILIRLAQKKDKFDDNVELYKILHRVPEERARELAATNPGVEHLFANVAEEAEDALDFIKDTVEKLSVDGTEEIASYLLETVAQMYAIESRKKIDVVPRLDYLLLDESKNVTELLKKLELRDQNFKLPGGRVHIGTIHSSKGREWKCVFLPQLNDRNLPYIKTHEFPDKVDEERRLLYVGVTRAESDLALSCSRVTIDKPGKAQVRSRFLTDDILETIKR